MAGRVDIKAFDQEGLQRYFATDLGEKPFRARQVYQWLWQKRARTFAEMTDVSLALRARLEEVAFIPWLELQTRLQSRDGTVKYLWQLADGHTVESVLIPEEDRLTLCMSTQVGCAMACTFCLTGDLGLLRHMSASEIASQPLQVQAELPEGTRISNLVLMGMGEPLHNLDALVPALKNCLDDRAMNFSHRRITVSTVGLVPKMAELVNALPVNLAVSLNATTEEQRRAIMPVTRRYSLEELMRACRALPLERGKRITFEYVMLGGFNDTLDDARRLVELTRGIRCKVNLIPYNENPDRDIRRPDDMTVKLFQHHLVSHGLTAMVRTTRGIDISAACGQLGKAREQMQPPAALAEAVPSD